MSAIFGIFHLDGQPVLPDNLHRMSEALADQGTDGCGIWNHKNVGLGQRMMRVTPEDIFETQPVVTADSRRILITDARIDNRSELMSDLGISRSEASELPDSEFILRAYEKWGEDCPQFLIGAFAFALWDSREQQLLLASSPFGHRPLFYYLTPQLFAFATRPKGLFALPFINREINEESMADHLMSVQLGPGSSFFKNINHLEHGHVAVVGRKGFKSRQYCQPELKHEIRFRRDEDYVEAFNEVLERAITDNLRSIKPVGAMMSGGLDSTCIAATASVLLKRQGKRLSVFTEVPRPGFDGPVGKGKCPDETQYVSAVAEAHVNLDLNLVRTDGRHFLEDIDSSFNAVETPYFITANRVWWEAILQSARRQGINALLTGLGGNMTISWAGLGLMQNLIRKGKVLQAFNEARLLTLQIGDNLTIRRFISQGVKPLLPRSFWPMLESFRQIRDSGSTPHWFLNSPIIPEFAHAQKVIERARTKDFNLNPRPSSDLREFRYQWVRLLNSDIACGHRGQYGVELRDPPLDERVVQFCLSLPEDQYLRNGKSRWLIKRAMADRVPAVVLSNKKRGLQAADWFERLTNNKALISAELARIEKSKLANQMLDLKRMRRLFQEMPAEVTNIELVHRDYKSVLESGLMAGAFLRWFEKIG